MLTEADLIALMEKHGIGTDATHAEHIETIKDRLYVSLNNQNLFQPAYLGRHAIDFVPFCCFIFFFFVLLLFVITICIARTRLGRRLRLDGLRDV